MSLRLFNLVRAGRLAHGTGMVLASGVSLAGAGGIRQRALVGRRDAWRNRSAAEVANGTR
jgi:hypothetical protein